MNVPAVVVAHSARVAQRFKQAAAVQQAWAEQL